MLLLFLFTHLHYGMSALHKMMTYMMLFCDMPCSVRLGLDVYEYHNKIIFLITAFLL